MPTVVIIHAAEDTLPARALAEKLRQAKLQVVLEKPPGEELRAAVKGAPVTIALWSPRSIAQAPLIDEVNFARGKSKVFHACMQSAAVPQQFGSDKSVNLTGWRGEDDFAPWRELAKLVADKAGVGPLPPPTPKPPSGFFQPGRPADAGAAAPAQGARAPQGQQQRAAPQRQAPPQAAPRAAPRPAPAPAAAREERSGGGGGRGLVIGLIAVVVIAALGGGGYWYFTQSQGAQTTAAAWEAVEQNDADALRAFLAGNPGEYRDEAQAALAALEDRTYEAASDADTIEALEAFLSEFPDSRHAIAARGRIAELRTLTPETPTEDVAPLPPTEPLDPDLVPPGSTATPPPGTEGPATLTPPPVEEPPAPEPESAPTN
jgi:hypothetical protein